MSTAIWSRCAQTKYLSLRTKSTARHIRPCCEQKGAGWPTWKTGHEVATQRLHPRQLNSSSHSLRSLSQFGISTMRLSPLRRWCQLLARAQHIGMALGIWMASCCCGCGRRRSSAMLRSTSRSCSASTRRWSCRRRRSLICISGSHSVRQLGHGGASSFCVRRTAHSKHVTCDMHGHIIHLLEGSSSRHTQQDFVNVDIVCALAKMASNEKHVVLCLLLFNKSRGAC